MRNKLIFSEFLNNAFTNFDKKRIKSDLISLSIEIPSFDLINIYNFFTNKYSFSSFWEDKNIDSYLAFDKCSYITDNLTEKFKLAKLFNEEHFRNINYLNNPCDQKDIARIIYFFSFSKELIEDKIQKVPQVEAVLPRIFIYKNKNKSWIRINAKIKSKLELRFVIEELWEIRQQIIHKIKKNDELESNKSKIGRLIVKKEEINKNLEQNISKAKILIENKIIEKIVLSANISFSVENNLDFKKILKKLRIIQPNTCRYLWKRSASDITFGASPEKLFSLSEGKLTFEAIAGTSTKQNRGKLINSAKNLKEHDYVVSYLIDTLSKLNIKNFEIGQTKVIDFGDISHLYTLILCKKENICPFTILSILHPSPAVCGYPQKEALFWIKYIEKSSRGNYASPIGWIDAKGNADFRVAIRFSRFKDNKLQFILGSGIVEGSNINEEIEEIWLKFNSFAKKIIS